jgi:TRAP transporter TAXI family solute receptor
MRCIQPSSRITHHASRIANRASLALLAALLLAGCGLGATPTPVPAVGQTPTPAPNVGPASAAQATTTAAMATAQAQARRSGPRQRLWLVTGGSGSAEERFGRGIAQSINDKFDGYEGSVEVTTGPTMNLDFLAKRQADLAIVTADAALEALEGRGEAGETPVRALARLYGNYLHLIVRADGPIRSMADLRGRRVVLGAPGSESEFLAGRALAAVGLNGPADAAIAQLGPGEALRGLRERTVDAVFFVGPAPSEPVIEFTKQPDAAVRLIPLDEVAAKLAPTPGGVYRAAAIPANAYPGQAQPVATVAVDTLLVAGAGLDERLAYGVTRAMYDNIRELPFFHPEAQRLTLLTGSQVAPLPFHTGATRFYREKGVLPSQ